MTDTKSDENGRGAPPSGRFVLRIDSELHAALRDAARAEGVSLNDYCIGKLSAPGGAVTGPALEVVKRAAAQLGEGLVGIIVYGSWARDELAEASDVDVLIIVDASVAIVRDLYRRWDGAGPQSWDGYVVEPHFAHLPGPGARISGLWAEAAVDGVVLFERGGLEVSKRLVEIRGRIVAGEVVRRLTYGQPYWVGAD